jgi:segregation and condensation protein B
MPDINQQSTESVQISLSARIEALLFVSPAPTTGKAIADALGVSTQRIQTALDELQENLSIRGIRLQENKGRYQLTSAPEASEDIELFLHLESTSRFSGPALEALAIIAYQQPITRPGIDAIRGVNSDSVLKNLLSKGLIEEIGRSEGPGRPILYGTSPEFLQYFGLSSIKDLPELDLSNHFRISNSPGNDPARQPELPLDNHLLKD